MSEKLTAVDLRRMWMWIEGNNKITPLHFDTKKDFDLFVEQEREAGWEIMTTEDMNLPSDPFPNDFYFVGCDGKMLYTKA